MDLAFWSQIATILAFLLATVLAINNRWPNLMMTMGKWKLPLLFAILSMVFGVVWYNASRKPINREWADFSRKPIVGQKFANEQVKLDGRSFLACEFINVKFEFDGEAPFDIKHCSFVNSWIITTTNVPFLALITLMRELRIINTNVPFFEPAQLSN